MKLYTRHLKALPITILTLFFLGGCNQDEPKTVSPEESRRQLLTLPYINWGPGIELNEAEKKGVLTHKPELAWQGINIFEHTNKLILMDMNGRIIREYKAAQDGATLAGFAPYGSQGFLVIRSSLALLDWNGRDVWSVPGLFHHDVRVASNNEIYVLEEARVEDSAIRSEGFIVDNFVTVIDQNGKRVNQISFLEMFRKSPQLLAQLKSKAAKVQDPFHTNTVEIITRDAAKGGKFPLRKGNIVFTSRQLNMIGAIDPESRSIIWTWGGDDLDAPHSARLEPSHDKLLIFDNGRYRRRYSRILSLDLYSGDIEISYQATPKESFFSFIRGTVGRLPNGNILVVESHKGRVFELSPQGEIVWEFLNTYTRPLQLPKDNEESDDTEENKEVSSKTKKWQRAGIFQMLRVPRESIQLPYE